MISGHDAARVGTLEIETEPVKEAKTLDGTGKQGKSQKVVTSACSNRQRDDDGAPSRWWARLMWAKLVDMMGSN